MEQTVQDTLQEHEQNFVELNEEIQEAKAILQEMSAIVHRLNREQITPVSEASAQAREVLG